MRSTIEPYRRLSRRSPAIALLGGALLCTRLWRRGRRRNHRHDPEQRTRHTTNGTAADNAGCTDQHRRARARQRLGSAAVRRSRFARASPVCGCERRARERGCRPRIQRGAHRDRHLSGRPRRTDRTRRPDVRRRSVAQPVSRLCATRIARRSGRVDSPLRERWLLRLRVDRRPRYTRRSFRTRQRGFRLCRRGVGLFRLCAVARVRTQPRARAFAPRIASRAAA